MGPKGNIKVGCCGFVVSQQKYFHLFRLVEIQSTFYQIPQLTTGERWRTSAPQDFEFTLKAWQLITHEPTSPTYRRLREKIEPGNSERYGRFQTTGEVLSAWHRTAAFARTLGASIIVFQCPARFGPREESVANMRDFFNRIDREGFRFVWEPRGPWPEALVRQVCEDLQLVHCVDPFKNRPLFGDFLYYRLHGRTGFAYRYTDRDLEELLGWVGDKPAYVLFNNNWMKEDALRFMELLKSP